MKNVFELLAEHYGVEVGENFNLVNTRNKEEKFIACFTEQGICSEDHGYEFEGMNLVAYVLDGNFEIQKIPKRLLTDEELAFLKTFIAFSKEDVAKIMKGFSCIQFYNKNGNFQNEFYYKKNTFKGLELGRNYSIEELEVLTEVNG